MDTLNQSDITPKQYRFLTNKMGLLPAVVEELTSKQAWKMIDAYCKAPPASESQYRYLRSLGAKREDCKDLTKAEADQLIKRLKAGVQECRTI